jgi:phage terminase large subunit-like protein
MDAKKGRWNFPELKAIAQEEYEYWEPELMLIEAKASGQPLADEMRLLNLPVATFSPGRKRGGGAWTKQLACILCLLYSSREKCGILKAKSLLTKSLKRLHHFPNGDHDDFCDSMTMALMRFVRVALLV